MDIGAVGVSGAGHLAAWEAPRGRVAARVGALAKDFEGYNDARVIGGNLVLMLPENKVLQTTIIWQGNKQDPLDIKYLGKLMDITTSRV